MLFLFIVALYNPDKTFGLLYGLKLQFLNVIGCLSFDLYRKRPFGILFSNVPFKLSIYLMWRLYHCITDCYLYSVLITLTTPPILRFCWRKTFLLSLFWCWFCRSGVYRCWLCLHSAGESVAGCWRRSSSLTSWRVQSTISATMDRKSSELSRVPRPWLTTWRMLVSTWFSDRSLKLFSTWRYDVNISLALDENVIFKLHTKWENAGCDKPKKTEHV